MVRGGGWRNVFSVRKNESLVTLQKSLSQGLGTDSPLTMNRAGLAEPLFETVEGRSCGFGDCVERYQG